MLGLSSEGLVVLLEVEESIGGDISSSATQRTEGGPRWRQIGRCLSRLWRRGAVGGFRLG